MSATHRLRASLIGVLGVIMAVVGFAAPSTAAPYTHHHLTTSVSNSHPAAGSTITFCGANFKPGERVTITIGHTRYSSVTASSSGGWCTSVALSSRLSGNVQLTATSTTSHRSSSTRIHIEKRHHGSHGWVLGESLTAGSGSNSAIPAGVAGVSANVAGVSANAAAGTTSGGLASTGSNAIAAGALGGLLLLGGAALVLVGRRRKVNA
jgi:LPXTG-motif cell wall-anchored protein